MDVFIRSVNRWKTKRRMYLDDKKETNALKKELRNKLKTGKISTEKYNVKLAKIMRKDAKNKQARKEFWDGRKKR